MKRKRLDQSLSMRLLYRLFGIEHKYPEPKIDISKLTISESGNIVRKHKKSK